MPNIPTRTNNPGDIKGSDGQFKNFASPLAGYGALVNDLSAKQSGNTTTGLSGTSSLLDFASKYAPSSDNNDPTGYANNIAKMIGVTPDTQIGKLDVHKFASAVAKQEGFQGDIPEPLSVDEFAAKIKGQYPQYANLDNNTLTQKIIKKYPEYKGVINFNADSQAPAPAGGFRYNVPNIPQDPTTALATAKANATSTQQASDKANSFTSIAGNTIKGVGDAVTSSEQALGNTIGGIINADTLSGTYADIATQNAKTQIALQKLIKDHEAKGLDVTNLKRAYNAIGDHNDQANQNREEAFAGAEKSNGQVLGELGGTALDLLSAGTYGKAAGLMKSGELATKAAGTIPTLAEGVKNLATKPASLFSKAGLAKVGEGAGLGYAQDVTQGLQGNRGENRTGGAAFIPGLGTAIGGGLPALTGGLKAHYDSVNKDVDTLAGTITQGNKADIDKAKAALSNIDTTGIKTYDDLQNTLGTKIKVLSEKLDNTLSKNTTTTKLKDLGTDIKVGDSTVTHNHVKDALSELRDHYSAINDPVGKAKIDQLTAKAKNTGLTVQEINNLAKEHGSTLNAFNANGQAASGLTKQAAENTRSGLKTTARSLFNDKTYEAADEQLSNLLRTKKLVSDVGEQVNKLKQKVNPRGLGEKAGRLLFQVTDKLTGGGLKGYIQSFLPRGDGLKTMNALDLEKGLGKNLKLLRAALDAPKETVVQKLENLAESLSTKKPSLIPLTPPKGRTPGVLLNEIAQRNKQAGLPIKPVKLK